VQTGDKRVNVVPNLGSVHWLWVQHHNHIANSLHKLISSWNDEILFQVIWKF